MGLSFYATYAVLWVILLFHCLLLLAFFQRLSRFRRQVERSVAGKSSSLLINSQAPGFSSIEFRSGDKIGLQSIMQRGGVIAFLSPECPVCQNLTDSLRHATKADVPDCIVLYVGRDDLCERHLHELSSAPLLLLREGAEEIASSYRVAVFPTTIAIDVTGKIIGIGHPHDAKELSEFFAQSLATAAPTQQRSLAESHVLAQEVGELRWPKNLPH